MPEPLPRIEPIHLADLTLPDTHPLAGEPCPVLAFAIRHSGGVVLVDTGVGGHEGIEKLYRPERRPLAEALREAGIAMDDVTAVVNTHLHFDHCGENALFPGVPIYVQAREYEAAREPLYTVKEYVDAAGLTYVEVDGEREIADGIRLIPTPGHTAGHQSVLVEGGERRAVIAGQAVYTAREFAGAKDVRGDAGAWDAGRYAASVALLQELGADIVYFSHDRDVWKAGGRT